MVITVGYVIEGELIELKINYICDNCTRLDQHDEYENGV